MASLSNTPSVIFLDIQDLYPLNSDLICHFKLNENYKFHSEDYVAIFKFGWTNITEYLTIKTIPEIPADGKIHSVTFSQHVLPKNTEDLYQICYINGQDLYGASSPFQFTITGENLPTKTNLKDQLLWEKDQEIMKLREENEILRESLKILIQANKNKDLIQGMKSMVLCHDKDINMLKEKIREGGEEYRKLYMEKRKVEKRYEKLKSRIKTDEIVEDLDLGDLKSIPPFPSIFK